MTSLTPELLAALALFALVSSITPGPNNTMLMASGANFGFRATTPHALGVSLGFFVLVMAVGLGLGGLFTAYPVLHDILAVIGGGYLLWLAWKIATAKGSGWARPAPSRRPSCRPPRSNGSIRRPGPWPWGRSPPMRPERTTR
ncbi:LysE family translocator [Phenylobacterium sp.]|uniref:LysE family translocator n=1 Tax=Phenylobacterium sp. TaxID=1871053 RepID=UPI00286BA6CA|nr:LysE family translocator [Phenylobacterium sp.]